MGEGIIARHQRCQRFWRRHLELSREFQLKMLDQIDTPIERLAILGAGRLLDVPIKTLATRVKEIHLFDADPGSLVVWRQVAREIGSRRIYYHLVELSGTFRKWCADLDRFLREGQVEAAGLIKFLEDLRCEAHYPLTEFDGRLSLNLLSQLPIYWRDFYDQRCAQSSIKIDPRPELVLAFEATMARLQAAHLEALFSPGARMIGLIYDHEFMYYRSDRAEWQIDPALWAEINPPIPYRLALRDSWYWHIAPQGIEANEYGSIHAVRGVGYCP